VVGTGYGIAVASDVGGGWVGTGVAVGTRVRGREVASAVAGMLVEAGVEREIVDVGLGVGVGVSVGVGVGVKVDVGVLDGSKVGVGRTVRDGLIVGGRIGLWVGVGEGIVVGKGGTRVRSEKGRGVGITASNTVSQVATVVGLTVSTLSPSGVILS